MSRTLVPRDDSIREQEACPVHVQGNTNFLCRQGSSSCARAMCLTQRERMVAAQKGAERIKFIRRYRPTSGTRARASLVRGDYTPHIKDNHSTPTHNPNGSFKSDSIMLWVIVLCLILLCLIKTFRCDSRHQGNRCGYRRGFMVRSPMFVALRSAFWSLFGPSLFCYRLNELLL